MRSFYESLGIKDSMKYVRFTNSFNGLTSNEKIQAIMDGVKNNPNAELTTRQVWLYLNKYLLKKEIG